MTRARDLADLISSGSIETGEITSLDAAKLTGTIADARVPASAVTQHVTGYDDNKLQANVALLGFKTAVNGSLAKYNLQDQIIDEFVDNSGVDTSASTGEFLASGAYSGSNPQQPTQNATTSSVDGSDTVLKYTSVTTSGNFTPATNLSVEYLVVAGGGGGGFSNAGGGGAGGYLANGTKNLSLNAGTSYTISVGAGGTGGENGQMGTNGGNSSIVGSDITDVISIGGGRGGQGGGNSSDQNGQAGGSGGGGYYNGGNGGAPTAGQGYIGGGQTTSSPNHGAGGGGGASEAGEAGTNNKGGDGGDGVANDITGSSVTYAGGGGGSSDQTTSAAGNAGAGGGGEGASKDNNSDSYCDATVNTGGGGGAHYKSGSGSASVTRGGHGGSGIVVLRYVTPTDTVGDMSLQSNDTTAMAAPTTADMVMLMENSTGTATLNTDIKGYISRDSGANFTQGTLVDEGTWGTNKKILGFHDLSISSQPSGTSLCYKITTHNQGAGSKITKVHAVSIGWK